MRETFTAREIGVHRGEDAIVCGIRGVDASGRERYLVLQRDTDEGPDDDGVHLELDDQAWSGYELIASCTLAQTSLKIALSAPVGTREIDEIEIHLGRANGSLQNLVSGLQQVFRSGTRGTLQVS